ncbi:MAG: efflux RND transporter periplasmic adaptor subunit [Planctomycetia bacterium]|nr:efflux RND transporter periplasmic adaptor subunit [Planctomycetia bacterium]
MNKSTTLWCATALLSVCGIISLVGCSSGEAQQNDSKASVANPPRRVTTMVPVQEEIFDFTELVGSVNATDTVDIQAQVSGQLEEVALTPGSFVKEGEVLFRIDKRVFQQEFDARVAAIESQKAALKVLEARLPSLKSEKDRTERLFESGGVSDSEKETAEANYNECVASIEECKVAIMAAEVAKRRAEIDLEYADVVSPIDGMVSRDFVTKGNLISANVTTLAKIVKVDPIHIYFNIYESMAPQLAKLGANGGLEIRFSVGDDNTLYSARLEYSDPYIDPSSGTQQMRAITPNPPLRADGSGEKGASLLPGQLVRVYVPTTTKYAALMVPEACIMSDLSKKYVYTVDGENKVQRTTIELGPLQKQTHLRVVRTGLTPETRVLQDNLLNVRPGDVVEMAEATQITPSRADSTSPPTADTASLDKS